MPWVAGVWPGLRECESTFKLADNEAMAAQHRRAVGRADFAVTQELAALDRSPGSGRLCQHAINEDDLGAWGLEDLDGGRAPGGSGALCGAGGAGGVMG